MLKDIGGFNDSAQFVLASISNNIEWNKKNQVFLKDFCQRIIYKINGFRVIYDVAIVGKMEIDCGKNGFRSA